MRLAATAVVVAALVPLAGCDPMPLVALKNDTSQPITVHYEFAPAHPGEPRSRSTYPMRPGATARFPAGLVVSIGMTLTSANCRYEFEARSFDDKAIDGEYGAVTDLIVGPDHQVAIADAKGNRSATQPLGWPWKPKSANCR